MINKGVGKEKPIGQYGNPLQPNNDSSWIQEWLFGIWETMEMQFGQFLCV